MIQFNDTPKTGIELRVDENLEKMQRTQTIKLHMM